MTLQQARELLEKSFTKTNESIKEIDPQRILKQLHKIREIDKLVRLRYGELSDVIERKIMDAEMDKMRKEGGRVDFMQLNERLSKNPYLNKINEEIEADVHRDLLEKVKEGKMSPLSYYRVIRHMTQEELAKKVGTTQSAIARAERLGYMMGSRSLKRYAKALLVNSSDLLPRK